MPIDLHRFVVFFHVVGMIGIVAGVTMEWISVRSLVQATTYEEVRHGTALWPLLQRVGLPSFLVVLVSGIYLATRLAVWRFAWAAIAVPTLVLVAAAGAVIGPRRGRIRAATTTGSGRLANDARLIARDPMILASWRFRTALLSGLVLEMTTKPEYAGVIMIFIAAILGIAWGALAWAMSGRRDQQ